nr:hypothetical protein [uncultured Methanoregula sp.]
MSIEKILKKIDALILEGMQVGKQKPSPSYYPDDVAPIPFYAWCADVIQFCCDNFDNTTTYSQIFLSAMEQAEQKYPSTYYTTFGIFQLNKLKQYVIENPDVITNHKKDRYHRLSQIYKNFPQIVSLFANRTHNRPPFLIENEYDFQDLLHACLVITFNDVRTEDWTPQYCGSSKRVDFLLKEEKIIIETKITSESHKAKEIGDELLIDISHYRQKEYCDTLSCLIYDPRYYLSNRAGFISDLEKNGNDKFRIFVNIVPP